MAEAHRPSVLLVDDKEANLVALEALLADIPCDLVCARNGNNALKHLLKREFAVMLLDVQMPGMDGFEVARYARDNPGTQSVPIIFLTAMHYTEDSVMRGYGSGAVDYLMKPFNAQVLRAKVRVFLDLYLGRKRLADEVAAHEKTLAALETVNASLRHFTHAAAHDLRAPLRATHGFLAALGEDEGDRLSDHGREYLNRAQLAGQRMAALLDSLLSYAQLQKVSDRSEVDCETLLEHVVIDSDDLVAQLGAKIEVGQLPKIQGDRSRLYQLFLNLVRNGIKFSAKDTTPCVRVSAEQRDGAWVFCVADNGIGIDAAHHAEIFDAFKKLHSERQYEGSGLGLVICKQIVEQHGGRLWVESKLGAGSRFYFTLAG